MAEKLSLAEQQEAARQQAVEQQAKAAWALEESRRKAVKDAQAKLGPTAPGLVKSV